MENLLQNLNECTVSPILKIELSWTDISYGQSRFCSIYGHFAVLKAERTRTELLIYG
jgi:hypothetical protein